LNPPFRQQRRMSTYRWGRTCGGEWGGAPAAIHTGSTAGPHNPGKKVINGV